MDIKYYLTCLWPGLTELWWRGRLSALYAAIPFAVAVNLLLITRYIHPGLISPPGLITMAFWIGSVAWVVYVVRSVRELPELLTPRKVSHEPDRFPEAQTACLQGRWADAEKLLTGVLAIEPRDPPALLLLSGLYRRTGRYESAKALLAEIVRLKAADTWSLEVQAEISRLSRVVAKEKKSLSAGAADDSDSADLTATRQKAA